MIERKNYGITLLCESEKGKNISGAADFGAAARRGHGLHTRLFTMSVSMVLYLQDNSYYQQN